MLTLERNVRTFRIKIDYLNRPYISDILFCFPEANARNLDVRQHAENINNVLTLPSTSSSSVTRHAHVAGARCTAVASCFIGGCNPSSVITTSLCSAVLLCMCMWCVFRGARAAKNFRLSFGNMVKRSQCRILNFKA